MSVNNKSSSVLKLSPVGDKFLLNILMSLKEDVLINSIGDPIITCSDNRNTVMIGINYYIPTDFPLCLHQLGLML